MATAATLYTPEILALAASLSNYPLASGLPFKGEARSRSCGSSLSLGLSLDNDGKIERVGLRAHACAIGQASAAIFAAAAYGRDQSDIAKAEKEISAWLSGDGVMPDWPAIEILLPAVAYPARHNAILLAWRAALDALSTAENAR